MSGSSWVTPRGLSLMGWLLTAYDVWSKLTKAQRVALETGHGQPAVLRRLEARKLWADGKPTPWAEFILASRRHEGLSRFDVDAEGNLHKLREAS